MGRIDKNVGHVLSMDFATASRSVMTPESQLKVYNHYNPTNNKLEILNDGRDVCGMRTTQSNMGDPVIKVRLEGNCFGLEICNQADEIINLFAHEKAHIDQCKSIGFQRYEKLSRGERETFAVRSQMSEPSWWKTRNVFRNVFIEYGGKYGLYIYAQ